MRSVPRISVTRPLANTRQWCHLWLSVTREPPDLVLPPSFDNTVAFNLVCICSWLVLCICTVFVQYLYGTRGSARQCSQCALFSIFSPNASLPQARWKSRGANTNTNDGKEIPVGNATNTSQVKSINAVFEVGVVFTVFFSFRHQVSAC